MRKIHFPILIIALIIAVCIFLRMDTYAGTCGSSTFSVPCEITPYNCTGPSCSLSGGLDATTHIVGGVLSGKPIGEYAQDIVIYFMGFVSVIALIYIIYAGAQVLTGAGDEEKMKKARQIIIYVILGIVIMWLARPIVKWTVDMVTYNEGLVPTANAAYTESQSDTFLDYKNRIREAMNTMESELLINKSVSTNTIQNLKNLIQQGYDRLPDTGKEATDNQGLKQMADTYLNIALQNSGNSSHIGNAISRVNSFIDRAFIEGITGEIYASPNEGNVPLSVSFRADNIKDPSGTTPTENNYIWWTRENGGTRRELSRSPSMAYTFTKEGNYTVFLDVISGSRNSKGKTDVLPLSISKQISVKPKLGNIVLLINGVNVSNMKALKLSPTIGKMGVIIDASASSAIGNGTIVETTWDFGNGNDSTNKGGPTVERQIYANARGYQLKLSMKTNIGQIFTKEIQLLVKDPAAIIKIDKDTGHIGEEIGISATSYFSDAKNTTYTWQIQDINGSKLIKAGEGANLKYKFESVGDYIVTLTAKSDNGEIDTDSKTISIESREPIINIDEIAKISPEKPNTILFDASKSYDPDSNSRKNLSYEWKIDDEKVILDNLDNNGAKGTYTFLNKGNHKVILTVRNAFGKISTIEKQFTVNSILSVNIKVLPKVGKRDTPVTLIGQSTNAEYYEWNMGDGSPIISGINQTVQYVYKRSGIFTVTLTVNRDNGNETNSISKKVYISDSDAPFAIIEATNTSNSIIEETNTCDGNSALVINRAESTTFNANNSVNTDGSTSGLSYTWKYMGKARTTQSINEKFNELGCFPIELTVRSNINGSSHTTKQYIKLTNRPPEITSLTTSIDNTKKDSQKLLVKVQANGAVDPDGVITSYIWYYTTESDQEPQNIQITQKNDITFVLPNITEKYYFGVILEDNDGAKTNSADSRQNPTSLTIDNANGNIYLPLITLTVPKTNINVGEKINFLVDVKTIIPGVNITNKSEYAWDFDGDGRIDEKTNTPTVDHVYNKSGAFNMKVRVTNNGVSNTKYQTINVKNRLKASIQGYRLPNDKIYLINASEGVYDKAHWEFGSTTSESLTSLLIDGNELGMSGKLTLSNNDNDISTIDIDPSKIETISGSGLFYQSVPKSINDVITVKNQNDVVMLSMLGNNGDTYGIDEDIFIDSNLDSIPDNDEDNIDDASYKDGSLFVFHNFDKKNKREQKIHLNVKQNGVIVGSKTITVILDYIPKEEEKGMDLNGSGASMLSADDKVKLEELSKAIRGLKDSDRIILMQRYNTLVENWNNPFDKAKSLIDIQEGIESGDMDASTKTKISKIIDELLIGDAKVTDEIGIAAILIRDLIPKESPNHDAIMEKLAEIESHPSLLDTNKKLGKEILIFVENDDKIPDKYKGHIKNQLLIIINSGNNKEKEDTPKPCTSGTGCDTPSASSSSWIIDFISGFVKIFFIIVGSVLVIGIIAFIFYRLTRKGDTIGFQDFLIDAVFHHEKNTPTNESVSPIKNESTVTKADPMSGGNLFDPLLETKVDPLGKIEQVSTPEKIAIDPISTFEIDKSVPYKDISNDPLNAVKDTHQENLETNQVNNSIPDWLKVNTNQDTDTIESDPLQENTTIVTPPESKLDGEIIETSIQTPSDSGKSNIPAADENIPDWIKNTSQVIDTNTSGDMKTGINQEISETSKSIPKEDGLPDWLVNSLRNEETPSINTNSEDSEIIKVDETQDELPAKKESSKKVSDTKKIKKKVVTPIESPTTSTSDVKNIPDWLK